MGWKERVKAGEGKKKDVGVTPKCTVFIHNKGNDF